MSEPFDAELRHALKEGTAKSLEGWEFTPAMRQKVLMRIQAEEQGAAGVSERPQKKFNPAPVLRPLAWVAVAAAALVIAVNIDLGGMGRGASQESGPAENQKTASAPAEAGAAQNRSAAAPENDAAPQTKALSNPNGVEQNQGAVQGTPVVALTLPEALESTGAVMGMPEAPRGLAKDSNTSMTLAAAAMNLQLAGGGADGHVRELSTGGIRAVDEAGAELWHTPVAGVSEQSMLTVARDGHSAVNAGNQVVVIGPAGKAERTLNLTDQATQVVWGEDGRLAVVSGPTVMVYRKGDRRFSVNGAEAAFGPDGTLAVLEAGASGRTLALYDQGGAVTMHTAVPAEGRGLAVMSGGKLVMAGGRAYDRAGNAVWEAPMPTLGIAAVGQSPLAVAWAQQMVVAVNAADGREIWRATWDGGGEGIRRVVVSPDGRYVLVLAAPPEGGAFWLLDQDGRLILSERLGEPPVDGAFAGNRALLLLSHSLDAREIPR